MGSCEIGVYAGGARSECGRWDASVECEVVPGPPLRGQLRGSTDAGAFAGDLPLDDQDGAFPARCGEQVTQHRCRDIERHVGHDGGVRGWSVAKDVAFGGAHVRSGSPMQRPGSRQR
jgi:hypothetical protein